MKEKVLIVCGATASGKTGFAVDMAKALGGEVVSADSMLVYRGMDIGTAKPTREEMQGIPHHMIDVADPRQNYSVSDYESAALPVCESIFQKGRVPVVCGGTGFYILSLLFTRGNGNIGADERLRAEYERIARERGNAALFSMLEKADPQSAEKLHPNDVKRVIRALEIYTLTGKRKSEQDDGFKERFPFLAVAFAYPREQLYARIEKRVDQMLEAGLVEEVEKLYAGGVDETCQSMQGIGYKEVLSYIKKEISYSTMCDIIKQNTRNYAKRQITFFKRFPGLVWLDPKENNVQKVTEMYYADRNADPGL